MPCCPKCGYDPEAKVVSTYRFLIDRDAPSLNDHVFNVGAGRHRYRKERDAWCWELRAVKLLQKIPRATSKRRVTMTRCFWGRARERDRDNLVGGMKPVVDALVLEGLLYDDRPEAAELYYEQVRRQPSGISFIIEVLPP